MMMIRPASLYVRYLHLYWRAEYTTPILYLHAVKTIYSHEEELSTGQKFIPALIPGRALVTVQSVAIRK
jgi:hypothetical protein